MGDAVVPEGDMTGEGPDKPVIDEPQNLLAPKPTFPEPVVWCITFGLAGLLVVGGLLWVLVKLLGWLSSSTG